MFFYCLITTIFLLNNSYNIVFDGGYMEKLLFKDLKIEFERIYKMGWIKSVNDNYNGVGLTFEKLLGKEVDDFSYPDYNGVEIKTQRINSDYPITLFGLAPWGINVSQMDYLRRKFGYFDYDDDDCKKLNAEFYSSKNILICNRYFFNLEVNREEEKIQLIIRDINYNVLNDSTFWFFDDIREKLRYKLNFLAFVHAKSKKQNGEEYFKYFKIEFYILKNFDLFLKLIEQNVISVSFTSAPIKYGPSIGKYKTSCYFRIGKFDLNKLFDLYDELNFYDANHY